MGEILGYLRGWKKVDKKVFKLKEFSINKKYL